MRVAVRNAGAMLWPAALLLLLPALLAAQAPELILYNGKILTVDKNFSIAQAVAVTGNKISAVGTDRQVLASAGDNTQKIDLKGRTVIPGIIDTHRHMYSAAEADYGGSLSDDEMRRYAVDWDGVKTKDDILNQLRGLMAKHHFQPGRWIYFSNHVAFMGGGGLGGDAPTDVVNPGHGGPRLPGAEENTQAGFAKILYDELNQWELNKVTPDNPVMMSMGIPDFNGLLLNKKAMDWLMGNYGSFVLQNGRYWIDAAGRPDGHLEPPASRLALPFAYDRRPEVLAPLYEKNMQEHLAMGMTCISTRLPKDSLAAYKLLEDEGKLTWRIGWGDVEAFGNTDLAHGNLRAYAAKIGKGPDGKDSDLLWMTSVGPTAIDGVTSRACTDLMRTGTYTVIDAWFPAGQCNTEIEYKGSPRRAAPLQRNYFKDWIMASGRDGVRFANTHVAGDRATANMLTFIEQIQQQYGPNATKDWALDHCDMVNPRDFPRIAKTRVLMSCYVLTSVNNSAYIDRAYGDDVANTYPSPLASMLKAGDRVVLESDSASYIWDDLRAAVTRKDRSGKVWAPQERVDAATALKMFTSWAAQYVLRADKLGSIEDGKLADLVVLDKDYLTIPGDDIVTIQPQLTIFDGKPVFVHTNFANEYNFRPPGAIISTYQDLIKRRSPRSGVSPVGLYKYD